MDIKNGTCVDCFSQECECDVIGIGDQDSSGNIAPIITGIIPHPTETFDSQEGTRDDQETSSNKKEGTFGSQKETHDNGDWSPGDRDEPGDDIDETRDDTRDDIDETRDDIDETRDDLDETRDDIDQTREDILDETRDNIDGPREDIGETREDIDETREDIDEPREDIDEPRVNSNETDINPDEAYEHEGESPDSKDSKPCFYLSGNDDSLNDVERSGSQDGFVENHKLAAKAQECAAGSTDNVTKPLQRNPNNIQESSPPIFTTQEELKSAEYNQSSPNPKHSLQRQESKWTLPRGHVSEYQGHHAINFSNTDLSKPVQKDLKKSKTSPDLRGKGIQSALSYEDVYDFNYPKRGVMVVIVNSTFPKGSPFPDRDGSEADLANIRFFARKFGFRLFNYCEDKNLTLRKVDELLNKARWHDHSDNDSFALFISTHGHEKENPEARERMEQALVCADGKDIFTSKITSMFDDENCPSLKGKPKLFFIQACRGKEVDTGCEVLVQSPDGVQNIQSRYEDDFIDIRGGRQEDEADALPTDDNCEEQETEKQTPVILLGTSLQSNTSGEQIHINSSTVRPSASTTTSASEAGVGGGTTPFLQCHMDQLVVYAIPPGMKAWRHTTTGSWMIRNLHEVTENYNFEKPKSLLSVLTKVNNRMSHGSTIGQECGLKAISVIEHKLIKDVIFTKK